MIGINIAYSHAEDSQCRLGFRFFIVAGGALLPLSHYFFFFAGATQFSMNFFGPPSCSSTSAWKMAFMCS